MNKKNDQYLILVSTPSVDSSSFFTLNSLSNPSLRFFLCEALQFIIKLNINKNMYYGKQV